MIQMVLLGLLVVFVGAVAYQWEQFNRGRRIDDSLEAPGPVGRFQPIDVGNLDLVILDTATGQLWRRGRDDASAAWQEFSPPVRLARPAPATKPPAWDDFGPSSRATPRPSSVHPDPSPTGV